ncbi:MAG: hypothetical protein FJ087_16330 [Deltaproteobacteria bacterium]|nr:hypothetical protein [Deltaproteobacteria bacterium]
MRRLAVLSVLIAGCGGGGAKGVDGGDADVPIEDVPPIEAVVETAPDAPPADVPVADVAVDTPPLDPPAPEAGPEPAPDVPADEAPADVQVADVPGDTAEGDPGPLTFAKCFAGQLPGSGVPTIDYDQFAPVMGSHCKGTNHQDIQGVERVVFVGDSIMVGTPPTATADWCRNRLAKALADQWGLEAPGLLWQNVHLTDGVALETHSGDFWTCAKWGARTDDLTRDPHKQMVTCNPPEERSKKTLIVVIAGGNDLFSWAQDMVKGVPLEQLWAEVKEAVKDLETSIRWAVDDPATFPNGVFVVFANTFEFSDEDSGNDLAKCPGAGIISMNTALIDPDFSEMARYLNLEYARIAVETGTDMVFYGESACGHGYMRDDPEGRCYKGPGATLWFDITCMHPGAAGHAGIADLILATIRE